MREGKQTDLILDCMSVYGDASRFNDIDVDLHLSDNIYQYAASAYASQDNFTSRTYTAVECKTLRMLPGAANRKLVTAKNDSPRAVETNKKRRFFRTGLFCFQRFYAIKSTTNHHPHSCPPTTGNPGPNPNPTTTMTSAYRFRSNCSRSCFPSVA